MTRKELIQLVEQILDVEKYTEDQLNEMLELLHRNVPHPAISDLIYYENLSSGIELVKSAESLHE